MTDSIKADDNSTGSAKTDDDTTEYNYTGAPDKETIRQNKINTLTRQLEVLELRANVLEAKVRIQSAQKQLR